MIKDLYKADELCLDFTNEEIIKHLAEPLKKCAEFDIKMYNEEDIEIIQGQNECIRYISFDGDKSDFYMSFWPHQAAIFAKSEEYMYNEEFMFIDDNAKQTYCGCDTYANVVYEGTLRDKTHEEILELMRAFVLLLKGAKGIRIEEELVSSVGIEYPKYNYTVKIANNSQQKAEERFDNILFVILCAAHL